MTASRILFATLAFASSAAFAGTAEVRFIQPDKFSDLATNKWEEAGNMDSLARFIQRLAQRLPADQVLHVDVLDVDLAGEPRDLRMGRVRIARNADFPVIRLRFTLESNGRVLRSGEERLTDLNYGRHLRSARYSSTDLFHERYLLDEWFSREFVPQTQAYSR